MALTEFAAVDDGIQSSEPLVIGGCSQMSNAECVDQQAFKDLVAVVDVAQSVDLPLIMTRLQFPD